MEFNLIDNILSNVYVPHAQVMGMSLTTYQEHAMRTETVTYQNLMGAPKLKIKNNLRSPIVVFGHSVGRTMHISVATAAGEIELEAILAGDVACGEELYPIVPGDSMIFVADPLALPTSCRRVSDL